MKALRHIAVALGLASMSPASQGANLTYKMETHGSRNPAVDLPPAQGNIGPFESPLDFHQLNFKHRNQRQLRKRRRQAAAAGKKNVFKKRLRGITR